MSRHRRSREHYVEVHLDVFEDDDILQEAIMRKLIPAMSKSDDKVDSRAEAGSIQGHLCCGRLERASKELERLIAHYVPEELLLTLEALRRGDNGIAICELDRFIEPPPSRSATMLPMKVNA